MISFPVTIDTKRNAVFGGCVILAIINMVNFLTVFIAYCTGVIVPLSDKSLKFIVKSWRIWLKRFTALPKIGFLSIVVNIPRSTRWRTILPVPSWSVKKLLVAFYTSIFFLSAFPPMRMTSVIINIFRATGGRAITTPFNLGRIKKIFFTTRYACQLCFTTLPSVSMLPPYVFVTARARTIKGNVFSVWRNIIFLSAKFTKFLDFHAFTLIRCIPFSVRHCYLGNVNQTRCV